MPYRYSIFSLALLITTLLSCGPRATEEIITDYHHYYQDYGVTGSFILYDEIEDTYRFYNKPQSEQAFTPASTFKICNSMIGLETGVIPDADYVIPWDSVVRNPIWDQDHDLRLAYEHSAVWYYQELARRVGPEQMKYWLKQAEYGNADISGGIDLFWLTGGLRITPMQQIDFLRRFKNRELPFSQRSMDITQDIMLNIDTLDYRVYGKTGWGGQEQREIGWFVGFVECPQGVYYFANCVQMPGEVLESDLQNAINFDRSRREIAYRILEGLELIAPTDQQ